MKGDAPHGKKNLSPREEVSAREVVEKLTPEASPDEESAIKKPISFKSAVQKTIKQRHDAAAEHGETETKATSFAAVIQQKMKQMKEAAVEEEAILEQKLASMHETRDDLMNQVLIARKLPMPVRILGVTLAFLAVICTWEALDHLVVYLFPDSMLQILAYIIVFVLALIQLKLSKMLTDNDWIDLGSMGFTLGSLAAAAATWGLVEALVRLHFRPSSRLAVWASGSLLMLASSFVYMLLTKHNALLDIASCANSLGYFDEADIQTKLVNEAEGDDYKGCATSSA